jgi:hypothetical protein
MFWIIGILFIIMLFMASNSGQNAITKNNEILTADGFSALAKIEAGKYIAGHPEIDKSLKMVSIFPKGDWLYIFEHPNGSRINMPIHKAGIQMKSIKNILAQDSSTIEKKVTIGRLLTVGIFAFAIKKNKKNELAYLTIEWNDGKFDHETYFEFEGKNAIQKANTARNALIRQVG